MHGGGVMKVDGYNQQYSAGTAGREAKAIGADHSVQDEKNAEGVQGAKNTGTVYAGDLNLGTDRVLEERQKAQAMAMQLISNAFAGDMEIDDDIEMRNQRVKDLESDSAEQNELLKDIANEREALKEEYGITEDSQEEKDLALLRKCKESMNNPFVQMTEEEKERLTALDKQGYTFYQEEMLRLDDNAAEIEERIQENQKSIREEHAIVRGIQLERLKYHDMVDAQKQGDQVLAAANKAVVGIIFDEAKNKIDQETEERKEELEAKKEEEEKLKERIEAAKDKKRQDNDGLDKMYELSTSLKNTKSAAQKDTLPDIKKSLNQVVNELKLTAEDLKGLVVDSTQGNK